MLACVDDGQVGESIVGKLRVLLHVFQEVHLQAVRLAAHAAGVALLPARVFVRQHMVL